MVTPETPGNTQQLGRAALAYATRGASVLPCHWPTPVEFPQFCSCTNLDCPDPARHPIDGLTIADATHDLSHLSRWWLAHPAANPATITDTQRLGVIEVRHFARLEHIVRLLNAYQVEKGPLINAGPGRLQFLVQPDHASLSPGSAPLEDATLSTLPPGTLVLLPPSRLMTGNRLGWMRRLNHVTQLPAATPFLAQLADFVATGALDDPHPLLAS